MNAPAKPSGHAAHPLEGLLGLMRRARQAESVTALRFIAINDCHALAPFDQGVLWNRQGGVRALSGVLEVGANTPYVQWLSALFVCLARQPAGQIKSDELPESLRQEWAQWLPERVLWLPFADGAGGGLLFARSLPWSEREIALLREWAEHCGSLLQLREKPPLLARSTAWLTGGRGRRSRRLWVALAVGVVVAAWPVRLSVLAPGELTARNPIAVRAPFDGVLERLLVDSNETIAAGQPLFAYERTALQSRLAVARESLGAAEAELRQKSQQALKDARARSALATARSRVEESRLEVNYLERQLERSVVVASQGGVAFIDDPSVWAGRALTAGQGVLRIASPESMEIEAWLSAGDAIRLESGDQVKLYLDASPLDPVEGRIRYMAFEAQERPSGGYAYRVRATIAEEHGHRLGLRGTARLSGSRAPLIYWIMRRPLAAARGWLGW